MIISCLAIKPCIQGFRSQQSAWHGTPRLSVASSSAAVHADTLFSRVVFTSGHCMAHKGWNCLKSSNARHFFHYSIIVYTIVRGWRTERHRTVSFGQLFPWGFCGKCVSAMGDVARQYFYNAVVCSLCNPHKWTINHQTIKTLNQYTLKKLTH